MQNTPTKSAETISAVSETPAMSAEVFAQWGLNEIAYIKRSTLSGAPVYAVHAANGEQVATAPARDVAAALVVQNDLTPVDVH